MYPEAGGIYPDADDAYPEAPAEEKWDLNLALARSQASPGRACHFSFGQQEQLMTARLLPRSLTNGS
jgi:hypothetical protein